MSQGRTRNKPSDYHMHREGSPIFLSGYVDDVLIVATRAYVRHDPTVVVCVQTRGLGSLTHLLALEVKSSYVSKLLKRLNMEDAYPRYTPLLDTAIPVKPPKLYGPDVIPRDIPYCELIGSLQYLVQCTRPYLANAVRVLSMFQSCYTEDYYELAKSVMAYVKATRDQPDMDIVGFVNADLGGDPDHGPRLELFFSVEKPQSRIKASCRQQSSMIHAVPNWLSQHDVNLLLFNELQVTIGISTLFWDNKRAIQVIANEGNHHKIQCLNLKVYKIKNYSRYTKSRIAQVTLSNP
ncbi:TPA: hypothetical protein N0F65_005120 [Lagenidium giganteum]|uniref:Reverse transcriptase Ty1/copia-type domain-containing protein n=1 Tax=Lagenidium giganteum TaxID=4803 RepID=A0AAV2Z3K9_9STRA|nr:TPA: hypothetical protein N0F65_005120 [Lagenidium giganteum]